MRMNGSCAGGTGAFLDEIATLLKVAPEDYDALAAAGTTVYDISGRCGVYAKTDIQPLVTRAFPRPTSRSRPCTPSPSRRSAAWRRASTSWPRRL